MHYFAVVVAFVITVRVTGFIIKQLKTSYNRMKVIYSLETCQSTQECKKNIDVLCERLVKLHLRRYSSIIDEPIVRTGFSQAMDIVNNTECRPLSSDECALKKMLNDYRLIFDCHLGRKVITNWTITNTEETPYDGDTIYLTVNYDFVAPGGNSTRKQLTCNWLVNVYSGNWTLKESFPSKQLVYTEPVWVKSESVDVHYEILEKVASGVIGDVYRCRHKLTDDIFAAKVAEIPKHRKHRQEKAIYRELDIINQLHHPNLLSLHDFFEYEHKITLIVDFLPGGQLRQKRNSSEAETRLYVRQICEAVKYLHERGIIHGGLCLENILCRTSSCAEIKIVDFKFAIKLNDKSKWKHRAEDPKKFGPYSDMWAIGDMTYVLLSGTYPFPGENYSPSAADCENLPFPPDTFGSVSKECIDFIKRLLVTDENKQMTIHEALAHPWLRM